MWTTNDLFNERRLWLLVLIWYFLQKKSSFHQLFVIYQSNFLDDYVFWGVGHHLVKLFEQLFWGHVEWYKLTPSCVTQVNINNWVKVIQSLWSNFCLMFKCIYHCSCDSFIFKSYSSNMMLIWSLHVMVVDSSF